MRRVNRGGRLKDLKILRTCPLWRIGRLEDFKGVHESPIDRFEAIPNSLFTLYSTLTTLIFVYTTENRCFF